MNRDDVTIMTLALDRYIKDLTEEAQQAEKELTEARALRVRAVALVNGHLRDEDVVPEVLRIGDEVRVSTAYLQSWLDTTDGSATVVVTNITVEPDGTKTVVVAAQP